MPSPLFRFNLRPLNLIQPWGGPDDPNLHWFGLTDGQYWIEAGESKLFEYSHAVQARPGAHRFCDYQVVRLYEDLLQIAPYALEVVPEKLRRYVALTEAKPWGEHWQRWREAVGRHGASEEAMDLLDDASLWISRRALDSAYLTPSTNISFWSDEGWTYIEWDNREKLFEGHPAWAAQFGSWRLPRSLFMEEVRSFHDRLIEQMGNRVSQVAAGALGPRVRVDIDGLHREQAARSRPVEGNLGTPAPPTDWSAVVAAIRSMEALSEA